MIKMQRISVFNICSEAIDMLKFSSEIALANAENELDYILILWNPNQEVEDYTDSLIEKYQNDEKIKVHKFYYKTNSELRDIENLRQCFNEGFNRGFELNDYNCGINTDIICGSNWLFNLGKYAREDSIINCRQLEPTHTYYHESPYDFGEPTKEKFKLEEFYATCKKLSIDKLITEREWGKRCDSTPYLIHHNLWKDVGEWNIKIDRHGGLPSDMMWFNRAKAKGYENLKSLSSICYHHGGTETKRMRQKGRFK